MKKYYPLVTLFFAISLSFGQLAASNSASTSSIIMEIADLEPCLIDTRDDCTAQQTFTAVLDNSNTCNITLLNWAITLKEKVMAQGEGRSFDYRVNLGEEYQIEFTAVDTCGNLVIETKPFTFYDCQEPDLILKRDLVKYWYNTDVVELRAKDLLIAHYDNCSYPTKITYKIVLGNAAVPQSPQAIRQLPEVLFLDCSFVDVQAVQFIAVDEADNVTVTVVDVSFEDLQNICDPVVDALVLGTVTTPFGKGIEGVHVNLAGDINERLITDEAGSYGFFGTPGMSLEVTLNKSENPANGVSTFDLLLMRQHILGIRPFDSPFQYLAGDINSSGTITGFDVLLLTKLVLGVDNRFSLEDSWQFVQMGYDYPSETPIASDIPSKWTIENMRFNGNNFNFIGIKKGDINANAATSALNAAEPRSKIVLPVLTEDQWLEAGMTYTIPFSFSAPDGLAGFQLSLQTKDLKIQTINQQPVEKGPVISDTEHSFLLKNDQQININWLSSATESNSAFALTFQVEKAGFLSEKVQLNQRNFKNEAYSENLEIMDLELSYSPPSQSAIAFKAAVHPNPIQLDQTILYLENTPAATLMVAIYNTTGQLVQNYKTQLTAGNHHQLLVLPEIPGTYWAQVYLSTGEIQRLKLVKL